ncbi:hypothetical protein Ahy_B05g074960 isoform B [Arachis hypogaea]|uniref:DUF7903 domain-containing protein n=2 Tax=Arachis hypogaea TaxID=3818 RepID=A0A444Z066_ARAHY|nr:hypothetical protein Ahy_B05g074960 isoform B [Arachis hypogaea]
MSSDHSHTTEDSHKGSHTTSYQRKPLPSSKFQVPWHSHLLPLHFIFFLDLNRNLNHSSDLDSPLNFDLNHAYVISRLWFILSSPTLSLCRSLLACAIVFSAVVFSPVPSLLIPRLEATISCKCNIIKEQNKLKLYKVELNYVRHMVKDVSCPAKNLDLRLMLCTKRIIAAPKRDGLTKNTTSFSFSKYAEFGYALALKFTMILQHTHTCTDWDQHTLRNGPALAPQANDNDSVTCIKCGNSMNKELKIMVNDSSSEVTHHHEDGAFVKGEAMHCLTSGHQDPIYV